MKKLLLPSIMLLIMLTSSAPAQNDETFISIHTGLSIPAGPSEFSDNWKIGFNIGGGIGFPIITNLRFQVNLDYNSFAFNKDAFLEDIGYAGPEVSISGGAVSILMAGANLKALSSIGGSSATPYVIGGVSFFSISSSDAAITYGQYHYKVSGDSETALGLAIGAGASFVMTPRMNIFFEAGYGYGFTENEDTYYMPIKVGLEFR